MRQPLGDLMQRTATVCRVGLELCRSGRGGLLRGSAQVFPEPGHGGPLLLVRRLQPLRVAVEPRLERLDQRPLPCRDLLETVAKLPLRSIEVLVPARKPLLNLSLHLRKGLGKPVPQALLALAQCLAPRLRQTPLVLGIRGERVGSPTCQPSLELRGTLAELLLHDGVDLGLRPFDLALDCSAVGQATAKRERPDDRNEAGQKARRRDRELDPWLQGERDPGGSCGCSRCAGSGQKEPLSSPVERGGGKRRGRQQDAAGEHGRECSLECHPGIVKRLLIQGEERGLRRPVTRPRS